MGSTPELDNLCAARQGVEFLRKHFLDNVHQGYFWSTREDGVVLDDRKYLHAQLMVLTALSKFVRASGDASARMDAFSLLETIKQKARDNVTGRGGWLEHFTRDWKLITEDYGPIGKHGTKTINTFIIFVDALLELYRATDDASVRILLEEVLKTETPRFTPPNPLNSRATINLEGEVILQGTEDIAHIVEAVWLVVDAQSTLGLPVSWELFDTYMTFANDNIDPGTGGITSVDKRLPWWAQAEYLAAFALSKSLRGTVGNVPSLIRLLDLALCKFEDVSDGIWIEEVDSDGNVIDSRKQHRWKAGFHTLRGLINFHEAFSEI